MKWQSLELAEKSSDSPSIGVPGSTCHPSGQQLPRAVPRLSRLPAAWCSCSSSLGAGQGQPCTAWDAGRARTNRPVTQPRGLPSHGRIGVFSFHIQARACPCLLRRPGPFIIPGDHGPDFPLVGRKLYGWPQGSAVSDTRCGTAV